MPRIAPVVLLAVLVAAGCGGDGEPAAIEMRTTQTSTTFVTLPIPSTTQPPPPAVGDDDAAAGRDEPEDEPEQDPDAERSYTVQANDYLVRIARNFDLSAQDIVDYNGWEGLNHPLFRGDVIRIPPVNWDPDGTTPEEAAAPSDSAADDVCETYTIRAGDTPGRVAARFDVTVDELDAANADTPYYAGFVRGIDINIPC